MFRAILLGLALAAGLSSFAQAQCSGSSGVPFNCQAGTTPGGTDLFLGGNKTGAFANDTVSWTGLEVAQGMFGLVSQFSGGGTTNFLRADGSWAVPPSGSGSTSPGGISGQIQFNNGSAFGGLTNTQLTADINVFTSSLPGSAPASGGGTANFLRADGTWATPPSSGGSVTWPASGDLVLSTGGSTPSGLPPVNGDCVVGAGGAWTASACPGGAVTYSPGTYTASGAISLSDSISVINSTSAVAMTLANDAVDGRVRDIKRFGSGTVTVTATIDGVSQTVVMNTTQTIRESLTLQWVASLSSYIAE